MESLKDESGKMKMLIDSYANTLAAKERLERCVIFTFGHQFLAAYDKTLKANTLSVSQTWSPSSVHPRRKLSDPNSRASSMLGLLKTEP